MSSEHESLVNTETNPEIRPVEVLPVPALVNEAHLTPDIAAGDTATVGDPETPDKELERLRAEHARRVELAGLDPEEDDEDDEDDGDPDEEKPDAFAICSKCTHLAHVHTADDGCTVKVGEDSEGEAVICNCEEFAA